jgi:hypothetical protein
MEITTPKAKLAKEDLVISYDQISKVACTVTLTPSELGGRTFAPGVYCSASPVTLNGIMYLDTQNKTGPVWIFQFAETLTTASSSQVVFIGTPAPCNVFWNIGTSVTLGSTSIFKGIINAYTSVSFGTGADLVGKAMAQTGAVTLLGNTITNCAEQAPGSVTCGGIISTDPKVCNNRNGTCVSTDACVCLGGYTGNQCTAFSCFGTLSTNPGVCSGNGTCVIANTCACKTGYAGARCDACQTGYNFISGKCSGSGSGAENFKVALSLAFIIAILQIFV